MSQASYHWYLAGQVQSILRRLSPHEFLFFAGELGPITARAGRAHARLTALCRYARSAALEPDRVRSVDEVLLAYFSDEGRAAA